MEEVKKAINHASPEVQEIALALRKLILKQDDKIQEDVIGGSKVKIIYYSIGQYNNPIGVINAAKDHCKLFLHHFNSFNHRGLRFEGKGKHSRHVKIRTMEEALQKSVSSVIESTVKFSKENI